MTEEALFVLVTWVIEWATFPVKVLLAPEKALANPLSMFSIANKATLPEFDSRLIFCQFSCSYEFGSSDFLTLRLSCREKTEHDMVHSNFSKIASYPKNKLKLHDMTDWHVYSRNRMFLVTISTVIDLRVLHAQNGGFCFLEKLTVQSKV